MQHSNTGFVIFIFICILFGVFLLHLYRKHFKQIILPNVFLVSGAVKSGKSFLSVHYALKVYKRNLRNYYITKFFCKLLHKDFNKLKPMFYSNMKLAKVDFNLLSMNILLRKVRIPDKSVVLLDEASLIADSMMYGDKDINNALTLFVKLFAHYSHGGTLVINTQQISDLHFSFKRCINNYLYISKKLRLPFFSVLWVREMFYASDNNVNNTTTSDMDDGLKKILVLNRVFKKYDQYYLSSLTDYLPYEVCYTYDKLDYSDDLKTYVLVSLQDFCVKINKDMAVAYGFDTDDSVVDENNENEVIENEEENKTI